MTLDKVYDPRSVEPDVYASWEASGAFAARPDGRPRERTFCIVIPPPNVTGALHLGHALNDTLQDVLIRWHRMRGFNTLWQPGTDHAGIATQAVVEKRIREQEGLTRHELGREKLVQRIWQWKDEYEQRILSQLKLMGCSCDWSRNRFTLDDGLSRAVRQMFFMLFRDGLIFRGKRLVNWDTQLQTAVSDDEVYHETVRGQFYHVRYPVLAPQTGEPDHVVVATTRPETMLGDVAVAVHPDPELQFARLEQELVQLADRLPSRSSREASEVEARLSALRERRASHLASLIRLRDMARDGRKLKLPLAGREIPLICDAWADPMLGTGCVKITPAHDPNDYEVGLRHNLPMINVLTPDGKVARIEEPPGTLVHRGDGTRMPFPSGGTNPCSPDYEGLEFSTSGRQKVVADLEARGLLEKIEDRDIDLAHSDRSKTPIEPFLSDQWFVRTGDPAPESEPRGFSPREPAPESEPRGVGPREPEPESEPRGVGPRDPAPESEPRGVGPRDPAPESEPRGFSPRDPAPESEPRGFSPREPAELRDASAPVSQHGHSRAFARAQARGSEVQSETRRWQNPDASAGATLLTWTTYGTWLPGDERGSVSRAERSTGRQELRNLPGEPYDDEDQQRRSVAMERMEGEPVWLTLDQARRVMECIAETCDRHGIQPLAVAVMANHVHVLCQTALHGQQVLQLFKGYASFQLGKAFQRGQAPRWWTKSGSRRRIRPGADLTAALEYVKHQDHPLCLWSFDTNDRDVIVLFEHAPARAEPCGFSPREPAPGSEPRGFSPREPAPGATLSDTVDPSQCTAHTHARSFARAQARGSGLAQAAMDEVTSGRIQVFPARYAKSYLDWLSEKRDWCISRQLWWGHRIPVWTAQSMTMAEVASMNNRLGGIWKAWPCFTSGNIQSNDTATQVQIVSSTVPSPDVQKTLDEIGLAQDPDVLDTWFSSALWPFSTLGWPEETAALKQYYPTSVLCTSRDIITNWVARMVMFGLYALGRKPFDHVYIHPKILDGRGETMSKSKGNGVDPVDIIHTHGADALRYTMVDMTTETQDIRMPVEYVCPHCGKLTEQSQALKAEEQQRKSRGMRLDRGLQPSDVQRVKCSHKECGREFATQWADAATKEQLGLGRETSEKFDIGRNFCNKLWNAARFAFMNLEGTPYAAIGRGELQPEDRWILAKLSQTCRQVHELLSQYQFSATVRELRDFFWDSLCDWYIELAKPRLGEPRDSLADGQPLDSFRANPEPRDSSRANAGRQEAPAPEPAPPRAGTTARTEVRGPDTARQVLAFCLDQTLRLLHPIVPFITERLWRQLAERAPRRGLPGMADLPDPAADARERLLITAQFPPPEGYPALEDPAFVDVFARLQTVVRAVRDLRARCNVPPKRQVQAIVVLPEAYHPAFRQQAHVIQRMAGVGEVTVAADGRRSANAGSLHIGELRVYVPDISDDAAERKRATAELADVERQIAARQARLANEKFVAHADPELVESERRRLAELSAQKVLLQEHLAELGEA